MCFQLYQRSKLNSVAATPYTSTFPFQFKIRFTEIKASEDICENVKMWTENEVDECKILKRIRMVIEVHCMIRP